MFSKVVASCVIVVCLYVCIEAKYTGTSYAYVSAANGGTEQVLTHSAEGSDNGQGSQINNNHIYQQDSDQKQTAHAIPHFNPHEQEEIEYYQHPKYNFKYGVEDPHTGDKKYQYEERDGDKVTGEYSLLESDGTVRTVYYTANEHDGFRAIVSKKHH